MICAGVQLAFLEGQYRGKVEYLEPIFVSLTEWPNKWSYKVINGNDKCYDKMIASKSEISTTIK